MAAESLGLAVAFSAGLLSFLSPCVLPLVPSYATFITGMTVDEMSTSGGAAARTRRTAGLHGLCFVLGFSAVFLLLGASATFLGALFRYVTPLVERVGGVLLIVFGISMLGLVRLPGAGREWRMHLARKPAGFAGTFLVGVTFGAGWTPCIGPVLGGILTLAATRTSMSEGMALLGVYSFGLAIPFWFSTVLLGHFLGAFPRLRPALPWISRASGLVLLAVGVLLVSGRFGVLSAMLAGWTPDFLMQRL
jgi:cytochrome c-type biogenesis protein